MVLAYRSRISPPHPPPISRIIRPAVRTVVELAEIYEEGTIAFDCWDNAASSEDFADRTSAGDLPQRRPSAEIGALGAPRGVDLIRHYPEGNEAELEFQYFPLPIAVGK